MATAVTASGGDTTAASTIATGRVMPGIRSSRDNAPTKQVVSQHEEDAEIADRTQPPHETVERELARRRVEQRRQHDREDDLGLQFQPRQAGDERSGEADQASSNGAWMLRRSAKMVTADSRDHHDQNL